MLLSRDVMPIASTHAKAYVNRKETIDKELIECSEPYLRVEIARLVTYVDYVCVMILVLVTNVNEMKFTIKFGDFREAI